MSDEKNAQSSGWVLKVGSVVLIACVGVFGFQAYKTFWEPYADYGDPDVMGYLEKENPKSLSGGDATHFHSTSGETFAQELVQKSLAWRKAKSVSE